MGVYFQKIYLKIAKLLNFVLICNVVSQNSDINY